VGVETWDPRPAAPQLSDATVAQLLAAAGRLDEACFGLDTEAANRLAVFARHGDGGDGPDWAVPARRLGDDELIALIRLFTLAESTFGNWEAGDASPVIPLAAELKRRGSYPAELTGWIRANSRNRFLPYGNLMKRL
jgi:hypothetical protein